MLLVLSAAFHRSGWPLVFDELRGAVGLPVRAVKEPAPAFLGLVATGLAEVRPAPPEAQAEPEPDSVAPWDIAPEERAGLALGFWAVDLPGGENGLVGWRAEASCLGLNPALFFPERGESPAEAKSVCAVCPVAQECADFAAARSERYGIWGGVAVGQPRHRRALKGLARRRPVSSEMAEEGPVDDAEEVRAVAVELVNEMREAGDGRDAVAIVAAELDLHELTLRQWVKAAELSHDWSAA